MRTTTRKVGKTQIRARLCGAATAALVLLAAGAVAAWGGTTSGSAHAAAAPKSITVAWASKMDALDPDIGFANQALSAFHLFGGNLYEIRAGGKTVPGLAKSGAASANGLKWTFHLRPGLRFSDGTPLTSADVKATIDRAKADKSNGYAGLFAPITSVTAPDAQTAVFNLSRKYPSLPTILAEPEFLIMPKAGLAKGKAFFRAPISAGPYKLVSWGGGNDSKYTVNANYWGPKPVISEIRYTTIADFNSRLSQLQSGQIDAAVDMPPSILKQLGSGDKVHANVVSVYGFASLNMWLGKPPLNDANVRKAISLAIDRGRIVKDVWNGQITAMSSFWPPSMTGFDKTSPVARDVAGAKKLLGGTRCENGCTLKMQYTDSYAASEQSALIIQSNLNEIGIKTQLVKLENGIWFNNMYNGKYQLSVSNLYDYADVPDGMITYGVLKDGGLNANYSGWNSTEAAKLSQTAIVTSGARRATALDGINRVFLEDQPFATLTTYGVVFASRLDKSLVSLTPAEFIEVKRQGA
jgi:peptide/nickel transport system substrate-binding protein